jgi:NDP-sugar pyrophosphorylase family protein
LADVVPPTIAASTYLGADMKAMVLAAGLGERMKPLTWNCAKPSLPLLNRPSILHLLEHLARNGVDQIAMNLHYRPETVRAIEPAIRSLGLRVSYSEEPAILGTGGGLKKAEPFLLDGTLVMVNSDFVTDCPLSPVLDFHRESHALATLVLTPFVEGTEYGAVEMSPDGKILRIAGRPGPDSGAPRYHFTGIHVLDPSIFQEIPEGIRSEINREVYPRLMERGARISGYVHSGFWRELGTPWRYLQGSLALLGMGDAAYLQRIRLREGVYSATPSHALHGTVEPVFLAGEDLRMAPDTFAAGAILGNRVTIGPGATLVRSILWDDVTVGDGSSLDECLVASGTRIPPGCKLRRKILLNEANYGGDRKGLERSGELLLAPV